MSQFRETFTKEEKTENVLNYDDSAFQYFAGCLLLCILIPLTIYTFKRVFLFSYYLNKYFPKNTKAGNVYKYCKCSSCVSNIERKIHEQRKCSNRLSGITLPLILAVCTLWYVFVLICASLGKEKQSIQQFNPFDILNISPGATVREIKKAYRVMSLKFHPDKNSNDPTSAAKFMLVNKAYQALTDEVAKANYEKYGNPDGPGLMKVGIGLPKFLVDEEYQLAILCLFFLFLLVIIPMAFICYYQRQKKYAPNGVQRDTLHFMTYYINNSTRLKNFPEFFSASAESRDLTLRESDDAEMKQIMELVVEPKKRIFNIPIIVRNYFLILCHMQRLHHLLSKKLQDDLNILLKASLGITHSMMEIATLRDWHLTAQSVVDFRRCLIQALDIRSSNLLQIPHFDEEIIKHCNRGKNAVRDLDKFISQPKDERKGVSRMSPQQLADIDAFCMHISNIEVSAKIFVEDENEIVVGDVTTCEITLKRTNLKENEDVGPVHAPYFPEVKYEEWWMTLIDKHDNHILGFVPCKDTGYEVQERIQFQATRVGKQIAQLSVVCDSYAGCDKHIDISYKVFHETEVQREVFVHPEDADLDNAPTLFQQMLGELAVDNSSDDEEDDSPKANDNKKEKNKSNDSNKSTKVVCDNDGNHKADNTDTNELSDSAENTSDDSD